MGMKILCLFIGVCHGIATSASVVVFISILGIVPQLAVITGTKRYVNFYGFLLCAGAVIFALLELLNLRFKLGFLEIPAMITVFLILGIFTGILLSAIAEVFDIFPAFTGKLGLKNGLKFLIAALALGKIGGSMLAFLTPFF